jgi:hypothetical protein
LFAGETLVADRLEGRGDGKKRERTKELFGWRVGDKDIHATADMLCCSWCPSTLDTYARAPTHTHTQKKTKDAKKKEKRKDKANLDPCSHTHSSTATATPSTDISSIPSATASAVASASSNIVCPYANRTVYSLESQNNKSFMVLCGRDYNSCCGAVDMLTVNTTTFEACLEQCGAQQGCTAVGWGNYYGVNTCWLKSAYGRPNWSGSWYAAVLVGS